MVAPSRLTQRAVAISCSRDSTAQGPAMTTIGRAGTDDHVAHPDPGAVGVVLAAGQLVGLGDAHDLLHAGHRRHVLDALDVGAHDTDHAALLSDA